MRFLKQNTATRVTVGPFFDKTDGVTPETALTVTSEKLTFVVDDAGVPTLVIDAAPTASGGNNDMVHITNDDAGFYDLELTAAQTNYVGRAMLSLTDAANHCPVFHEFTILPANVYDSMFGSDYLQVDMTQIAGSAVSASSAQIGANVVNWKGSAAPDMTGDAYARLGAPAGASISADVAAVKSQTAAIETDTQDLQTQIGTDGAGLTSLGDTRLANLDATVSSRLAPAGTLATVTAVTNDVGITQAGADKVWSTAARALTDKTGFSLSAAGIQAIWDALTSALTTVGSIGKRLADYVDAAISSRSTYAGGAVASVTAAVTVGTNNDKTGYSLATAPPTAAQIRSEIDSNSTKLANLDATVSSRSTLTAQGVWEYATRTVTSFGTLVADIASAVWAAATRTLTAFGFNVTASSVTDKTGYSLATAPPTAAEVADAVWDEAISGHLTSGTTGAALNAAGSSGDPWSTTLPGAYGAGTAGKIVGDNLNAPVATVDNVVDAIKAKTDNLPAQPAAVGSQMDLVNAPNATAVAAIQSGLATAANLATVDGVADAIKAKTDNLPAQPAAVGSQMDLVNAPNATAVAAIQSGLATAANLATVDGVADAIKAKTDNLPAAPAATGDIPTATENADALLTRDMSAVTGEAARSPLNALRAIRNKTSMVAGTLTVTKEDDATAAWTAALTTDAGAEPITGVDPS